jgi:hypothetical protein
VHDEVEDTRLETYLHDGILGKVEVDPERDGRRLRRGHRGT